MENNKLKKLLPIISAGLGLYLVSTGISYAIFSSKGGEGPEMVSPVLPTPSAVSKFKIDISGPKTEVCPLNGVKYTKGEQEIWVNRRPLLMMIENHADARPQSGLSKADVIYEAVAEGGISRFMPIFYCGSVASAINGVYDVGPVRSARTYFLDWASEYSDTPLYVHVGGAGQCNDPTVDPRAKALCQIEKYGWKNKNTWSDMDQFALGIKECRREENRVGHEVATEHQMYCSTEALWARAEKRGLTNVNYQDVSWDKNFRSWQFKDDTPSSESVSPEFGFWKGLDADKYKVKWEYDRNGNLYKRFNGGVPHIDFSTNSQLTAKNVVIQFAKETGGIDEHKHLLYGTTGTGRALIFQDGLVIEGKWNKKLRTDRTIFTDKTGREVKFNRGQIWIETLPLDGEVTY